MTGISGMGGTAGGMGQARPDSGFGQVLQQQGGSAGPAAVGQATPGQAGPMASALAGRPAAFGTGSLVGGTVPGGTGPAGLVAQGQAPATADPTAALRSMSVPDPNGNGIYELSDRQGMRTPTVRELATAIRESGASKVLVGEIHPTLAHTGNMFQSNPAFWELALEVRKQGRPEGQKVLLAIEQQASGEQQDLLRKLNSGKIMPALFEREWAKAAAENHRRVGGPERPEWAWTGEARDIMSVKEQGFLVAYVDPNRFGGDRERGMARAIERESEAYGDNVITLARVGGAHSAIQTVSSTGPIELSGWKKPIVASDWANPAGRILNERDDAGTLSIMIDGDETRSLANPDAPNADNYGVIRPVPHGGWEFILPGLTK